MRIRCWAGLLVCLIQLTIVNKGISQFANINEASLFDPKRAPRRKLVLLGPHDRYNFGDILFEKVLTRLLIDRAGYRPEELVYAGLISINMTRYGGQALTNLKKVQELSFTDRDGPFDIVYTGGEALACDFMCALAMLGTEENKKEAIQNQVSDCGYLIPKALLVPPLYVGLGNFAVINSMGGSRTHPNCSDAISTADHKSFRDGTPGKDGFPDSAVMIHALFAKDVRTDMKHRFPGVADIVKKNKCYVAVQHKKDNSMLLLPSLMDTVASVTNCTIVFFVAGTALYHDSFDVYEKLAHDMSSPHVIFREENALSVVSLVAHAHAVLSTSLHVRIMAFVFQKPRVTWCSEKKHRLFIDQWEGDSEQCSTYSNTLSDLQASMDRGANWTLLSEREADYLNNFHVWSSLLVHGHREMIRSD